MRIFYASDVHGSEKCWRKFLGAAKFYEVDTLIMGGDLTGKVLTPIIRESGSTYVANVFGTPERVDADGLQDLEKRVRFNGFYPYRCDGDEYEQIANNQEYRDQIFRQVMVSEVRRWVELAEERLRGSGVRCLVMPGNDDDFSIDEVLASDVVVNPDNQLVTFDGIQIISSPWTNITPWDTPREESEDDLLARLRQLIAQLEPGLPAVFNFHCPPYGSGLDEAPAMTEDLRVVKSAGQTKMESVGSRAVRAVIEEYQPVLSLHSHIHESRGIIRIGRTTAINPGSSYGEGTLDGAVIEMRKGKVHSSQLVSG